MPRILIGDDFDFEFTSKPTDRNAEPITIKYRPPTPLSLAKLDSATASSPEIFADVQAEFLAENIGSWNVDDREGNPVPITKDAFKKIRDWNLLQQFRAEITRSELIDSTKN